MGKFRPGIPDGFSLNVDPVGDLGDFLDEPGPSPIVVKKPKLQPPAVAPSRTAEEPDAAKAQRVPDVPAVSQPVPSRPPTAPLASPPPAVSPAVASPAAVPEPPDRPKAPRTRREINMTHETLRMVDELVDLVRNGSGQRDTKPNEVFHALVLLAHEAMAEIDPHALPKRGRWGTPTAWAYPREIRNVFLAALLKKYAPTATTNRGPRVAQ